MSVKDYMLVCGYYFMFKGKKWRECTQIDQLYTHCSSPFDGISGGFLKES